MPKSVSEMEEKRGKAVSRETRERKEQAVHPFQVGKGALPFS